MKKLALLLLSLTASGLWAQNDPPDVNYAVGVLLGQSLASTGLDFDFDLVLLGIKDSLGKGGPVRLDVQTAQQVVSAAMQAAQDKVEKVHRDQEDAWLAEHGKKPGVVTTASGLQYEVLKEGTGAKPVVTDTVKVDYVGTLLDGKEFDSSIKRGQPAVFTLEQVIPAWTEGLQLMTVGSKYRLTIPSGLAYGPKGAGEVIPPYSTLVFEVELLSIEPAGVTPPQD